MIYTYEISFNGSDYLSFTPNNHPVITTAKEEGEYIWRDGVDEFKINESLNEAVYGTLENWFDDPTKHAFSNRIRIKKSGAVKYNFVFGVKKGEINYENKYYAIQPEPDDVYADLLYYSNLSIPLTTNAIYHYNDEDDPTPEEIYAASVFRYDDAMTVVKNRYNSVSANTYDIESAFLWNDNYPDGSSSGSNNYISSDYNYLNNLAMGRDNSSEAVYDDQDIEHYLDLVKMFQCYWFCGSDYVMHFEHVRWFRDQINNSQLDLTGEDHYDDSRTFKYSDPEVYSLENFSFPNNNGQEDYDGVQIIYEPELVLHQSQSIEVLTLYDTFLSSDFANFDRYAVVGIDELVFDYRSVTGWDDFDPGTPDVTTGLANGSGNQADTNYLSTSGTSTINYSVDITYSIDIPLEELELIPLIAGSPGTPVTLNSGVNSGSFLGDSVRIQSTGTQHFEFTISLKISGRYRIPWEVGEISTNNLPNNYMSWANNLNRFWRDDRYAISGEMNESAETFLSAKMVKQQEDFKFYHAGDIDPMRGITTDYGIGMIQTMERDLETDFITLKLRYE